MTFRNWIAVGLVLAASAAWAQQNVLLDKSEIHFVSTQMGVPVEGKFKRFTADVNFDAAKPETSRADIAVDLASIDIGSPDAETEVKRKGWFDVAATPQAKFVSTAVKKIAAEKYEVAGKLTIKGITKDIVIPITLQPAGNMTLATGNFVVKRLDYKIGSGPWADVDVVADAVDVRFKLALAKK